MTMLSVNDYLPFYELVRILGVTLIVALVAPSAASLAIVGLDRRHSGSTGLGNSLIALGAGTLILLVALGLYALIDRARHRGSPAHLRPHRLARGHYDAVGSVSGMIASCRYEVLLRRGLRLEFATLGWNVVGSVIVIAAAVLARSVALAGFGLDSLIEILASAVVVWQLRGADQGRERRAMRIIGVAFIALAGYIALQSGYVLVTSSRPDPSRVGIAWLALTVVVMFGLAAAKARTGRALGNPVLETEARVTLVDGCLAAAVLAGLVLNAWLGWWWADPLAGFVIVYYGIREGHAALAHARPRY